jgi:hypothetical protein
MEYLNVSHPFSLKRPLSALCKIILPDDGIKGFHSMVWFGWLMVFSATFNNIAVISWRSVLLVEETRIPRESH